jgi:hypothetical protein
MFTSNFSAAGLEGAVIGVAVLLLFMFRQFSTRSVTNVFNILAPLALLFFGLQGVSQLDSAGWVIMSASLSLGVALGFARGMTFRIWMGPAGQALMRGSALTLGLWVLTFVVKIGMTYAEARLGYASDVANNAVTLLPGAATLAAQALVVWLRAQDLRFGGAHIKAS